tara:strand:+ start:6644 stop:6838 length:195 start_codon:yes stop_codon:yes gene_type:complete
MKNYKSTKEQNFKIALIATGAFIIGFSNLESQYAKYILMGLGVLVMLITIISIGNAKEGNEDLK